MPIYVFRCGKCEVTEEVILPISDLYAERRHICGAAMDRLLTTPRPPVMKANPRGMTLDMLNNKATVYMKPEHKQVAFDGLKGSGT